MSAQTESSVAGKWEKYPANDERILHEAEKRVYQEFSQTLKIERKEIPQYIMERMAITV